MERSLCLLPPPCLHFFKDKTPVDSNGAVSEGRFSSISPGDLATLVSCNSRDDAQTPETKTFSLPGNGTVKTKH